MEGVERKHDWYSVDDYADSPLPRIFRQPAAIRWEVKQHADELIAAGVFIRGQGRRPHLVRSDFETVALALTQERQRQELLRSSGSLKT